ncbi:MAG: hypothetical protein ABS81_22725 [Pseudonocardia sp. SCN 72-86]|nr:MAG: hypothetical protein ABS81_22725 [Pseudonocardia sp. SCN 72-86]
MDGTSDDPVVPWRRRVVDAVLQTGIFVAAAVAILWSFRSGGFSSAGWAVTSVALVMQDKVRTSGRTALLRVCANLTGALVAFGVLALFGATIPGYVIGLSVTGLFCYLAGLSEGIRSAYVSVIIVIGADPLGLLAPAVERVGAVLVGSVVGIALSLAFEAIDRARKKREGGGITERVDG